MHHECYTSVISSNSGSVTVLEGPLNRITIESRQEGRRWIETSWNIIIRFDLIPDLSEDLYILPLHVYVSGFGKRELKGRYYDTYVFLVLTPVYERPGCYRRRGLGEMTVLADFGLSGCLAIQNSKGAPCKECFGRERGHRIRLL